MVAQHGIDSRKGPCLLNPGMVKALVMDRFVEKVGLIEYIIIITH